MPRDQNNTRRECGRDSPAARGAPALKVRALCAVLIRVVWVLTVIFWPILRWVIALDCVIQLVKAMYQWHTPGSHAGLVFILHFFAFSALTYFVSAYRPKGF